MKRSLGCLITLALLSACGDDTPGGGGMNWGPVPTPEVKITLQERISLDDFQKEMSDDQALASASQGLTLSDAGRVENDHNATVVWGEGISVDKSPAGAVKLCDAQGCKVAIQGRKDGDVFWLDAAGTETTMRGIGQPSLLKNLQGHDLANRTTLEPMAMRGLGITMAADDIPSIDFSKRRFVALNTFGDLLDLNLKEITDAATSGGDFDSVEEIQYVRENTLQETIRTLDNLDVAVWLSQGVREVRKTGANPQYRTVGLTVNRAVYGEAMLTRQDIETMWSDNVANGPGIFFLAASNSYSDGHPDQPESSSLWMKLEDTSRILIGVKGHATPNAIIRSTAMFFNAFLSGETTLGKAIQQANGALAESGAQLLSNQDDLNQKYLRSYADVWNNAPFTPSGVRLTVPIVGTPQCGEGDGPKSPREEDFATAWADITFDGAYFSGNRKIDSQTLKVDTHIRGVITGFEEGDHVYIETYGDMDKAQFQDFHAFGIAVIEKAELNDEGKYVIEFTGPAHVAEYHDEDGYNCVMVSPSLATTTGVPATLVLTP
jgi:hypothetical protein